MVNKQWNNCYFQFYFILTKNVFILFRAQVKMHKNRFVFFSSKRKKTQALDTWGATKMK